MKIAIVGAGAAGMFCALNLDTKKHQVTVFEKNSDTLKKLLITGHGRCNVTNLKSNIDFLENVSHNKQFLFSALNMFSSENMVEFLNLNNVETICEKGDRVFPKTNKAITIKNCFDNLTKGIVALETVVLNITKKEEQFVLETNKGSYNFDVVIIATGGVTYPTTGSNGDGFKFAKEFNIDVLKPRSSLCGIRLVDVPKNLEGTPLNCKLSVVNQGKIVASNKGEFLFTSFGVSGPNVFTLTSKIEEYSINGFDLSLDLLETYTKENLILKLKEFSKNNAKKHIFHAVNDLVNLKLSKLVLSKCEIDESKQCANISNAEFNKIAETIKALTFKIENFDNIECATVTRGGVNVKEINPKTMESKKISNLYFIGEVLDVDGFTGGYNLQIAFSTAFACAKHLNDIV